MKDVYMNLATMNFGQALDELKNGARVTREGWNGKEMFIFLIPGSTFQVTRHPLLGIYPIGTTVDYMSHIAVRTHSGRIAEWAASHSDLLAEDWTIVGNE